MECRWSKIRSRASGSMVVSSAAQAIKACLSSRFSRSSRMVVPMDSAVKPTRRFWASNQSIRRRIWASIRSITPSFEPPPFEQVENLVVAPHDAAPDPARFVRFELLGEHPFPVLAILLVNLADFHYGLQKVIDLNHLVHIGIAFVHISQKRVWVLRRLFRSVSPNSRMYLTPREVSRRAFRTSCSHLFDLFGDLHLDLRG